MGEQWPIVDAPGRADGHVGEAFVGPDGDGRTRLAGGTVDGDRARVDGQCRPGGRDRDGRHAAEPRGHERCPGGREHDQPGNRGGPSRRPRVRVDRLAASQGAADLPGEIGGRDRPDNPDDDDREVGPDRHRPCGGEIHEVRRQGREQPESGERERHSDDEDTRTLRARRNPPGTPSFAWSSADRRRRSGSRHLNVERVVDRAALARAEGDRHRARSGASVDDERDPVRAASRGDGRPAAERHLERTVLRARWRGPRRGRSKR